VLELPQDLVEDYALLLLVDEIARALTRFDEPARVTAIAELVRGAGLPVGSGLVKRAIEMHLAAAGDEAPEAAPRVQFCQEGRRYDLAWRSQAGSLDRAMRSYLEMHGRPAAVDDLVHQTALALQQGPKETHDTVVRILESRDTYFVYDRRVGLRSWLLDVSAGADEDVVLDNFWDEPADGEDVLAELEAIAGTDLLETAWKALDVLGPGISVKMVLLAWWKLHPDTFDPVESFCELLAAEALYVAPTHAIFPAEAVELFHEALAIAAETIDDVVGDDAESEGILAELEVGPAEVALAVQQVMASPVSISVEGLVEQILEVERHEPGFDVAVARLDEGLREQGEIAMCGRGRWIAPGNRPEGVVDSVPDQLLVQMVRVYTAQGGEVDVELDDAGLEDDLADRVRDPYREDLCEEDEPHLDRRKITRPESVTWAAPAHHTLAGTMKIRLVDGDFYGGTSGVSQCVFHYAGGGSYPVWANHSLGLIYGLGDFYAQYCPAGGSVLRLSPAAFSGEYRLEFDGETDPDLYLSPDDVERLQALREEAAAKEMSVYDIVCQLLEHKHAGISFERLVSETNSVRRTRRRLVASVLSLYHCFHQRGKDAGIWQYDPRKAEQGRRKAKRKFIRQG
jgi:hypothetical protein